MASYECVFRVLAFVEEGRARRELCRPHVNRIVGGPHEGPCFEIRLLACFCHAKVFRVLSITQYLVKTVRLLSSLGEVSKSKNPSYLCLQGPKLICLPPLF